ncbi:hypothetical protein MKZ38_006694 [Zalerion maritima]|uniref:Uncharacterized protein n=1 Tax=Zalerion maritima TaxID=339359 RepID=A0AAD5RIS9_9PEZI|nr:hypothetical protein MKZ38_006694 [Zalerion maritima]
MADHRDNNTHGESNAVGDAETGDALPRQQAQDEGEKPAEEEHDSTSKQGDSTFMTLNLSAGPTRSVFSFSANRIHLTFAPPGQEKSAANTLEVPMQLLTDNFLYFEKAMAPGRPFPFTEAQEGAVRFDPGEGKPFEIIMAWLMKGDLHLDHKSFGLTLSDYIDTLYFSDYLQMKNFAPFLVQVVSLIRLLLYNDRTTLTVAHLDAAHNHPSNEVKVVLLESFAAAAVRPTLIAGILEGSCDFSVGDSGSHIFHQTPNEWMESRQLNPLSKQTVATVNSHFDKLVEQRPWLGACILKECKQTLMNRARRWGLVLKEPLVWRFQYSDGRLVTLDTSTTTMTLYNDPLGWKEHDFFAI